ncbi:hypothetical protein [Paraflavitalea speifideaquila]|uniref:hypothetical protein n=1 Tax=Paraflavitalea speifideaquila TaxID=3076558 RepID=UPI0028E81F8F|nr:hypothetical protein [Paraflavitalea speifideiaquila]
MLEEARHAQNPDPKEIKEIEAQLRTLEQLLIELEKELAAAEVKAASLQQQQQEVNARREQLQEKEKTCKPVYHRPGKTWAPLYNHLQPIRMSWKQKKRTDCQSQQREK